MAVASLVLGIIAVCCCCVSGLSLVLGIIASVLAIISIIVAQTDWYQTTVTQQLIDTFGDQYADMLN